MHVLRNVLPIVFLNCLFSVATDKHLIFYYFIKQNPTLRSTDLAIKHILTHLVISTAENCCIDCLRFLTWINCWRTSHAIENYYLMKLYCYLEQWSIFMQHALKKVLLDFVKQHLFVPVAIQESCPYVSTVFVRCAYLQQPQQPLLFSSQQLLLLPPQMPPKPLQHQSNTITNTMIHQQSPPKIELLPLHIRNFLLINDFLTSYGRKACTVHKTIKLF